MAPDPQSQDQDAHDPLRPRDWVVAIVIGLVLVLIIAALFRNGLGYLFG